jgi:Aminoglycoside-2''-adenylyltransferase
LKWERLEDVASAARSLMAGFGAPWYVAGGWALDLFLGRATRPHDDLELAVFRGDQSLLHAHLRGWTFLKIVDGSRRPWRAGDWLALPVHEVHARSPDEPSRSIEFLLNERDGHNWVFRRNPAIILPLNHAAIVCGLGVPVLAPEIVLLFKAKSPRAKDEADFRAAHNAMDRSRRRWLRAALQVCHPGHPWIELLDADGSSA